MGGELLGGLWFAWGMKLMMGLWWCLLKQMGNKNYNLFDETWWTGGHWTFGTHEEGSLLKTLAPCSKNCLLPHGNFRFTKLTWNAPKFLDRLQLESKVETSKKLGVEACSTFRGRRACWSSDMGLGKMTSLYLLTQTCTKPSNELINALREHFWC
jgi:hypothetical protein